MSKEEGTVLATKHGTCRIRPLGLQEAIASFEALTVRGVTYKGHMRFREYGHGLEASRENPENPNSSWHALYATRTDQFMVEPTKAAKNALREALTMAAKVYKAEHPGAFILEHAKNLEQAVETAKRKVSEAQEALTEAENIQADAEHSHETFCKLHNL